MVDGSKLANGRCPGLGCFTLSAPLLASPFCFASFGVRTSADVRGDYHCRKIAADPLYRQVCRDSQRKWRDLHPDYPRRYRQTHPDSVQRNREGQRRRDRQRRLQHLVKNNLALDLKHSAAEVWLLGPEVEPLVKNNLAFSQALIYQAVPLSPLPPQPSCKEHPSGLPGGPRPTKEPC